MKIELRKLSEIKAYANNPRQNADAVAAVAASLKEFGFQQPLVVDTEGILAKIGGYAATAAMIEADLAAGAPTNADGTINLIHYGAWLVREVDHDD